jgi:hypothetical protein
MNISLWRGFGWAKAYSPGSMNCLIVCCLGRNAKTDRQRDRNGELAIAMIILSRVLKYGINRWVNIVMGIIIIAYIWGGMATYPHFIFIAGVETICLPLIIWYAWSWRREA